MTKLSKHDVILKAVADAKNSQFKATAVKVELEAHFNRGDDEDEACDDCGGDGVVECDHCNGSYEDAEECSQCNGYGYQREVEGETENCNEDDEHARECESCLGSSLQACSHCEEGRVTCEYCDGPRSPESNRNWSDVQTCHDWLMSKLAEIGLAEYKDDILVLDHTSLASHWYPKGALKYAEFYNDGSVDSEFTFTISIKNAKSVFLIPKIVEIFRALGEEIGNGINVSRAGMHMALLNHSECKYGPSFTTATMTHRQRYGNFQRSMTLLLPALFFLASNDNTSRQLEFRVPKIDSADRNGVHGKYSAINYTSGALEFRTFETCYQRPEATLDNFVVMSNCLKYWTTKYKSSGLEKIANNVTFGNDSSDQLERFYCTIEHIDLLNSGLAKLKPAYMTIRECKQQRKFNTDKAKIHRQIKAVTEEAKVEYIEYEERFSWYLQVKRKKYEADYLSQQMSKYEGHLVNHNIAEVMSEVEKTVEQLIIQETSSKKKIDDYVKEKLDGHNRKLRGRYALEV